MVPNKYITFTVTDNDEFQTIFITLFIYICIKIISMVTNRLTKGIFVSRDWLISVHVKCLFLVP